MIFFFCSYAFHYWVLLTVIHSNIAFTLRRHQRKPVTSQWLINAIPLSPNPRSSTLYAHKETSWFISLNSAHIYKVLVCVARQRAQVTIEWVVYLMQRKRYIRWTVRRSTTVQQVKGCCRCPRGNAAATTSAEDLSLVTPSSKSRPLWSSWVRSEWIEEEERKMFPAEQFVVKWKLRRFNVIINLRLLKVVEQNNLKRGERFVGYFHFVNRMNSFFDMTSINALRFLLEEKQESKN